MSFRPPATIILYTNIQYNNSDKDAYNVHCNKLDEKQLMVLKCINTVVVISKRRLFNKYILFNIYL